MTDDVMNLICKVRKIFNQSMDPVLFGFVRNGLDKFDESYFGQSYSDFLHVCDGLWLGQVVLYGVNGLKTNQHLTSDIDIKTGDWLCIGNVDYGYLMMELSTEYIYLFHEGYFYKGAGYDDSYYLLGDLDYFLTNYVFGELYTTICSSAENDEWYAFLKEYILSE